MTVIRLSRSLLKEAVRVWAVGNGEVSASTWNKIDAIKRGGKQSAYTRTDILGQKKLSSDSCANEPEIGKQRLCLES